MSSKGLTFVEKLEAAGFFGIYPEVQQPFKDGYRGSFRRSFAVITTGNEAS